MRRNGNFPIALTKRVSLNCLNIYYRYQTDCHRRQCACMGEGERDKWNTSANECVCEEQHYKSCSSWVACGYFWAVTLNSFRSAEALWILITYGSNGHGARPLEFAHKMWWDFVDIFTVCLINWRSLSCVVSIFRVYNRQQHIDI